MPRGALLDETLDLLDASASTPREVRANDRRLLFEDVGIVTMRPSDVPTYVEAGAADIGIVGKDVLIEQSEREVYELLDLGYGGCTMVLATVAGEPDPAAEALRRLGVMRVATKYPRLAARYLEDTGRQAEIVEVKGSVELAPLTGLVEAIVDLTATGTTLRENGLVVREEIVTSTARLIANPVAHKLKAAAIDEVVEGLRGALSASRSAIPPRPAARVRALVPAPRRSPTAVRGRSSPTCARHGDAALEAYVERFDGAGGPLRVGPGELDAALDGRSTPTCAPGWRWRSPTSPPWRCAGCDDEREVRAARGPERAPARGRRATRGHLRARRPRAVPLDGRHGRGHGARGRASRRSSCAPPGRGESTRSSSPPARCAAPTRSTAWAAPRRSPRWPTAPRRCRASTSSSAPATCTCRRPSAW